MKRIIINIAVLLMICTLTTSANAKNFLLSNHKITMNGESVLFKNSPVIIEGKTFLPLRETANLLGIDVEWNEKTQSVMIETERKKSDELLLYCVDKKYGYINTDGEIIIPAKYDLAYDFVDGMAIVANYVENYENLSSKDRIHNFGVVDVKGNELLPPSAYSVGNINEGHVWIAEDENNGYYLNQYGYKAPHTYMGRSFFTDGYGPMLLEVSAPMPNSPLEVWCYVDSSGKIANDNRYEWAGDFVNGIAAVKKDGKFGAIDENLNVVIDFKYEYINPMKNNNMIVVMMNDKIGIIDRDENVIIPFEYFSIGEFSNGLVPVRTEMEKGAFIDKNGKIHYDGRFSMVYDFVNGYACVKDSNSGKYGVIDIYGNYVIEPKYKSLLPSIGGIVQVRNDLHDFYYIRIDDESEITPH